MFSLRYAPMTGDDSFVHVFVACNCYLHRPGLSSWHNCFLGQVSVYHVATQYCNSRRPTISRAAWLSCIQDATAYFTCRLVTRLVFDINNEISILGTQLHPTCRAVLLYGRDLERCWHVHRRLQDSGAAKSVHF